MLSANWFTSIPEEKELAKTHAPKSEDRFYKSQRHKLSDGTTHHLTFASVHWVGNHCRKLLYVTIAETNSHVYTHYPAVEIHFVEKLKKNMSQKIIKLLRGLRNDQLVRREKLKVLVTVEFCENGPRLFNHEFYSWEIGLN